MRLLGEDQSSEGTQYIDPVTGEVTYRFRGGIELDLGSAYVQADAAVRWVREADGVMAAFVEAAAPGGDIAAELRHHVLDPADPNRYAQINQYVQTGIGGGNSLIQAILRRNIGEFSIVKTILGKVGANSVSHFVQDQNSTGYISSSGLRGGQCHWGPFGVFADLWFRFYGPGAPTSIYYGNLGSNIRFGNDLIVYFDVTGTYYVHPWWHFSNAGAAGGVGYINSTIHRAGLQAGGLQLTANSDGLAPTINAGCLLAMNAGEHIRFGLWNGAGGTCYMGVSVFRVSV